MTRQGGASSANAGPANANTNPSDAALQALGEWLRSGSGSGVIEARAGSGKTTAIIGALSHVPEDNSRTVCLMFNRRIMEELSLKLEAPLVGPNRR